MSLEILDKLHQEIQDQELGEGTNVSLYHSLFETDAHGSYYILWFICKVPIVNEDMFQKAMMAYYNIMKDYAEEIKVRITSIIFTGGLKGADAGINILDPQLNFIPAYVRQGFKYPTPINEIPDFVSRDAYTLNTAAVEYIGKFFKAIPAQNAVIKKADLLLRKLVRGSVAVQTTNFSDQYITINYTFPDGTHIYPVVDPSQNYKVHPTMNFDWSQLKLTVADQDAQSFLAIPRDNYFEAFCRKVISQVEHHIEKFGIKIKSSDKNHLDGEFVLRQLEQQFK